MRGLTLMERERRSYDADRLPRVRWRCSSLFGIDARGRCCRGATRRGERRRDTARKALGFEELLAGDVEAMKRHTRNYAKRQLTWMRKLAGVRAIDVTGRDPDDVARGDPRLRRRMSMRFEKWQALGNDYLIVEHDELPFELTPARVRRLCEGHFGVVRRRGAAAVSGRETPSTWRTCGSSTRTAPRRSCRATARARRSCICAGAGGPRRMSSRSTPRPGRSAGDHGLDTCRVDMGSASLTSKDFPGGARRRPRRAERRWADVALQARVDRQPAVRDPRRLRGGARRARPGGDRPGIEGHRAVPESHERVVVHGAGQGGPADPAGAHPRADLRARRGGDAVLGHRRDGRRGRLSARRRRARGGGRSR